MTPGRIAIIICFALLLGVPLAFRPVSDSAGDSGSTVATGDAQTLIIITPHNEQIRYEFKHAFERWHQQHFGQRAKVVYNVPGGTTEIRRMLESQYTAAIEAGRQPGGDADLVFGGGTFEHGRLKRGVRVRDKDEPISQPVDFTDDWLRETYGENKIGDDPMYDKDRYWFGLALSGFGIAYNRDNLESLGVPEPQAWRDMCDPRLVGWVALVNPSQSGSVTTAFESILKREGWIEGWHILRRMAANARYFSGTSLKPPLDVTMGDAAECVCIDFYGRFQSQALKEAGDEHRLGYVDPPGGSTIDSDPISMLRGAPHPEVAKRFIEFCLSDEGQALWQFPAREASPSGFGPQRYELRRLPVKRSMYDKYADVMIDKVNPFAIATPAKYPDPNFRDFIAPMFTAMGIDNQRELRAAWQAIITHPAYPRNEPGIVTADDVSDPQLKAMLRDFDALPVIDGPVGRKFDLADTKTLGEVRSGWLRGGWAKDNLWDAQATPIDALRKHFTAFFRTQYAFPGLKP
jgi:ABC-type Fe3+ transport system substrate-binding protein